MTTTPNIEKRAIAFATEAHDDQKYGTEHYTVHLAAVRQVLADFGIGGDLTIASWLHDTLEDTTTTYGDLVDEFGPYVADLVHAVSGYGRTRKARVANAYEKIVRMGPDAAKLKVADRIANVESSVALIRLGPSADKDRDYLALYHGEQEAFERMLGRARFDRPDMLARLRAALGET